MKTRVLSPDDLRRHLDQPGRYGKTAGAVLETCALVAAADASWTQAEIESFQQQEEIHEKVWGKLIAISKDERLKQSNASDLPKSYTALYALVVMSQPEWDAAVEEGVVSNKASSRSILDWTQKRRMGTPPDHREVIMTLLLRHELDREQMLGLQQELNIVCKRYEGTIFPGRVSARTKSQLDKRELSRRCLDRLKVLLREIVRESSEEMRESFGIYTSSELAQSSKKIFSAFLQRHLAESGATVHDSGEDTLITHYPEQYLLHLAYLWHDSNSAFGRMTQERYLRRICANHEALKIPELQEIIKNFIPQIAG